MESRKQAASRPSPPLPRAASDSMAQICSKSSPASSSRLAQGVVEAQVQQAVGQGAAHEEFQGQVVDPLGVRVVVGAHGLHPPLDAPVAHHVGADIEPVAGGGGDGVLAGGVLQAVGQGALEGLLVQAQRIHIQGQVHGASVLGIHRVMTRSCWLAVIGPGQAARHPGPRFGQCKQALAISALVRVGKMQFWSQSPPFAASPAITVCLQPSSPCRAAAIRVLLSASYGARAGPGWRYDDVYAKRFVK